MKSNGMQRWFLAVAMIGSVHGCGGGSTDVDVPVAVKLLFLTSPGNSVAGATISPPVRVAATDAGGHVISTFIGSITIGPVGTSETLTGTLTRQANAGIASFTDLRATPSGLQFSLVASAPGLAAATCEPFDLSAPVPTRLAFLAPPAQGTAGNALDPAVVIAAQDGNGVLATSFNEAVSIRLKSNPGGAVVEGTSTVVAINGLATFSNVRIRKADIAYELIGAADGLQSVTSSQFTILALTASKIAFASSPSDPVAASNFGSDLTVVLQDSLDNLASSFSGQVTLAIGVNPPGGTLYGTLSTGVSAGIASFSQATIDRPGIGYTLVASVSGMPDASSPPFQVRPLRFVDLQAGGGTTCGVTEDHRGFCWGYGADGELGYGPGGSRNRPVEVAGAIQWRAIYPAAGGTTCGISTTGIVYCWGESMTNGPTSNTPRLASPGFAFDSLTVGDVHLCALTSSGAAYCWGRNNSGELGDGTESLRVAPKPVLGGLSFRSLSAGTEYTCGVSVAGDGYCWGLGSNGQGGDGDPQGNPHQPSLVLGGIKFLAVHAGGIHTCGVAVGDAGYCWGDDSFGELGDGAFLSQLQPVSVSGGLQILSIDGAITHSTSSASHTCAVATSGTIYCWGHPGNGAFGDGSTAIRAVPGAVSGGISFVSVTTGSALASVERYSCGISSTGTAYCWGDNATGSLGDGTNTNRSVPSLVVGGAP